MGRAERIWGMLVVHALGRLALGQGRLALAWQKSDPGLVSELSEGAGVRGYSGACLAGARASTEQEGGGGGGSAEGDGWPEVRG